MASKKIITPHVDYLDECLAVLKQKTNEAKQYLENVRWQDLETAEEREKEFKFQSSLTSQYVTWLNEYAKLSGITEKLTELLGTQEKDVRKGSYKSVYATMLKDGEFD